jgi:hypothetical protein
MGVFVLLFNVGTDNEGLHTLQIGNQNWVLMFEEEDDATRYAMLLEAQDFPIPAVEEIDPEVIEDFCQSTGYSCQLVPKGFVPQSDAERLLIVPPENNVEETAWQLESRQEPEIPDEDLDQIRRKLEGLL